MITSTLDIDVAALLADRDHRWESFVRDGTPLESCSRCGRQKDDCRDFDPASPAYYLPCRGFT